MGFYAARSHNIIPAEQCYLGVPVNEQVLTIVQKHMQKNHIRPYDEVTQKGLLRHVLIRYGFASKEVMVCLVVNGTELPEEETLCQELCKLDGMTSISINTNTNNTNVILGDKTRTLWGQDYISDTIHRVAETATGNGVFEPTGDAVTFQISPQSFYQVNPIQTEKLYSTALEYAGLTGKETVWDLYCGIGTISLFLAQKAQKVYGVEIVPQAIADARKNARLNHMDNTEFFVGKAEEVLPDFYSGKLGADEQALHPDVIVVDPPRKGCDELCLDTMLKMQPGRIVYVSCDSATLARDLKILCEGGYELKRVRAVDQFCHSMHIETVTCLHRVNS